MGIPVPAKLSRFLQAAWGDEDVREPFHNQPLKLAPALGAWGNLLVNRGSNLIAAVPKSGKSALIAHVFACARRGDPLCLGKSIRRPWNKLIISGNDMDAGHWGKILLREGLATHIPDPNGGEGDFLPCEDVLLWDLSNPARMNEKGIAAMREKCLAYPDSLLVIDSLRSNTDTAIKENDAEIRGPIEQLKAGLAGCEVTIALIHHANKGTSSSSAVSAASGSNAITGSTDGTLLLKYLQPETSTGFRTDFRLMLASSGRIQNDRAVVELTQDGEGRWIAHEDADDALRAEAIYEMEERLTSRQLQVYEYAEELAEMDRYTTSKEIGAQLNLTDIKARKSLEQLTRKGLLVRCGTIPTGQVGREQVKYAPTLSALARAGIKESGVLNISKISFTKESELKPQNPQEPRLSVSPREGGLIPPLNTPVERCIDGCWANGWKLHHDTSDEHHVVVWRELSGRTLIQRNLRWGADVRICQPVNDPSQFDF